MWMWTMNAVLEFSSAAVDAQPPVEGDGFGLASSKADTYEGSVDGGDVGNDCCCCGCSTTPPPPPPRSWTFLKIISQLIGEKNFFRRPKFDHDNDDDDDNNNRNTTIRARKAADRGVTTAHSGPSGGRTAAAAVVARRNHKSEKKNPR
ncbi:Sodium channel protein type 2 subunit alpha [Trichinella spiralis]|uniref:Sodium channel protein type 2 subunit alpha n=1 Tax=Trichinella spiralis TaxID=6334 RepID=A0ABR3KLI1_TRISP